MANKKNLIPLNERSQRERIEIAKKGAAASNEVQRRRKSLRESMNALLDLPILNAQDINDVQQLGVPLEEYDNSQVIVVALFNRAKLGDVAAIRELRDLIGEDNKQSETESGIIEMPIVRGKDG